MAALILIKVWFEFVVLTLIKGSSQSSTSDLLESVDCLLRDCERYIPNADRNMTENLIVQLEVAKTAGPIYLSYVKSNWISPVQQSVAMERYLEEVKLQPEKIRMTKPKQNLSRKERKELNDLKRNTELILKS